MAGKSEVVAKLEEGRECSKVWKHHGYDWSVGEEVTYNQPTKNHRHRKWESGDGVKPTKKSKPLVPALAEAVAAFPAVPVENAETEAAVRHAFILLLTATIKGLRGPDPERMQKELEKAQVMTGELKTAVQEERDRADALAEELATE